MLSFATAPEVLTAMITPAVLISASGTLVLSTSNRLNRVVDRVRSLGAQAQAVQNLPVSARAARRQLLTAQLQIASARALLLRAALTALYLAIGLLVATSIIVGIVAALDWAYGWVAVLLGLLGTGVMLYGSALLLREARLAVSGLLQELAQAQASCEEASDVVT